MLLPTLRQRRRRRHLTQCLMPTQGRQVTHTTLNISHNASRGSGSGARARPGLGSGPQLAGGGSALGGSQGGCR